MNRYRKLHRFAAILVLVCFFTAIAGVSAFAGHACCGNCAESVAPDPVQAPTVMAADSCCPVTTPVEPTCACTFQSGDDQDQQAYSLAYVSTACDDLLKGLAAAVSTEAADPDNRQARVWTTRMEIRARSGPIYLTNQSILC
jgi:hypothetical protein